MCVCARWKILCYFVSTRKREQSQSSHQITGDHEWFNKCKNRQRQKRVNQTWCQVYHSMIFYLNSMLLSVVCYLFLFIFLRRSLSRSSSVQWLWVSESENKATTQASTIEHFVTHFSILFFMFLKCKNATGNILCVSCISSRENSRKVDGNLRIKRSRVQGSFNLHLVVHG